jgi:hypothetical protein
LQRMCLGVTLMQKFLFISMGNPLCSRWIQSLLVISYGSAVALVQRAGFMHASEFKCQWSSVLCASSFLFYYEE